MMKKNILKLYNIFDIESLWDIVCILDKQNANIYKEHIKKDVLKIVKKMLEQEIIYIGNKWVNKELIKWKLSKKEIIKRIDTNWNNTIEFQDLYSLAWIGYNSWYINALIKIGYDEGINWEEFVEKKIGDLDKWIDKNKPTNN